MRYAQGGDPNFFHFQSLFDVGFVSVFVDVIFTSFGSYVHFVSMVRFIGHLIFSEPDLLFFLGRSTKQP